jgi:nucleotide-binding universal stress UspA family protein
MDGIVVGVDRSPAASAALDWALAFAAARQLPVTLVRAWTAPTYGMYGPASVAMSDAVDKIRDNALNETEEIFQDSLARVPEAKDLHVAKVALMGGAEQVLRDAAGGTRMIVVGSRGAGALSRAVLGSVSSSVLHHATAPVAIVPEGPTGASSGRVVVGVDHSPPSLAALAFATEEARLRDGVLVPVAVREAVPIVPPDPGGATASLAELEASERRSLKMAVGEDPQVQVEPHVLAGSASAALLEAAQGADLLVLGSRGRGGFKSLLLGSTSTQCAQHAPCPVVVVRGA